MSPEQIEGKEADARSDIFALGAVLYEMATGKRPFEGKSQLSLASSILEKDPDPLLIVKPETPPAFDHLVNTCLQKNPDDRYQSAHDVKIDLQWIAGTKQPVAARAAIPAKNKREQIVWPLALILAIVVGTFAGFLLHRPAPAQSIRMVINPPEKTTLNLAGDSAGPPVLSPDGLYIAFAATATDGKSAIWIRPVNALEARVIVGTENAIFPFWSPDSRSLGFFADGKLKTIEIDGGTPQVVADAPFGRGGAWGTGGVIVFSPNTQSPLMRVSVSGGTPVALTQLDIPRHTSHRWPFFVPDGKHFIYLAINHDPSKSENNTLYYASVDGKENRALFRSQSNAIYADGYVLFGRGDQLMAQAFNPSSGSLSGEPQTVARGIVDDAATWHVDASASEQGLLIVGNGGSGDWQLVWVDRSTKAITTIAEKISNLRLARISPQGDRVVMEIDTGTDDIWILDLNRGVRTRLTFGPVQNNNPVWSPDGKWIAYDSDRNGRANLCRKLADGSGAEEILMTDPQLVAASDWSRDGKYLIYQRGPLGGSEIWALPVSGERKPFLIVGHTANSGAGEAHLSPNGRWLAYTSTESGGPQVYVTGFQGAQGKWQVSSNGGQVPQWSHDGKELYFLDPTFDLLMVPVKEVDGALQFGATQTLISGWSAPDVFFDVSPDGKRILLDRISQQVSQSVTAVTNFTAALKK
jgi:Tol biopolymer transport system component